MSNNAFMSINNTVTSIKETPTAPHWDKIGIYPHYGVALPLFSLRSQKSSGIGEFLDLIPLISWSKSLGFDVIQLLPLNDLGPNTSPYSAISAFALNPLHLSIAHLPGLNEDPSFGQIIKELRQYNEKPRVDYEAVGKLKDQFLRAYFAKFGTMIAEQPAYLSFKQENAYWLPPFALFKTLKVQFDWKNWEEWPEPYRNPSQELIDAPPVALLEEIAYHIFVQFLCFQQFKHVKQTAEASSFFIKGDIPILINRDSADVWFHRHLFDLNFAAGAPPDMYNSEGQKWGFPLYNWDAMVQESYEWWVQRLIVSSCGYHIYRIDHIVGFFRIWGIHLDKPSKEGCFFPSDWDSWLHHGKVIMKMMIEHCHMLPIGEDLGTVPTEVRDCLRSLGICGTKVMRWERRWNEDQGYIDPKDYVPESMTTVSTHDSETLAEWWKNNPQESHLYADTFGLPFSPELTIENRLAILKASNTSNSLFHINLLQEYLALIPEMVHKNLEEERINVPGTVSDTNWTYKFVPSLEEITESQPLRNLIHNTL